jgi:hypothetical protein
MLIKPSCILGIAYRRQNMVSAVSCCTAAPLVGAFLLLQTNGNWTKYILLWRYWGRMYGRCFCCCCSAFYGFYRQCFFFFKTYAWPKCLQGLLLRHVYFSTFSLLAVCSVRYVLYSLLHILPPIGEFQILAVGESMTLVELPLLISFFFFFLQISMEIYCYSVSEGSVALLSDN